MKIKTCCLQGGIQPDSGRHSGGVPGGVRGVSQRCIREAADSPGAAQQGQHAGLRRLGPQPPHRTRPCQGQPCSGDLLSPLLNNPTHHIHNAPLSSLLKALAHRMHGDTNIQLGNLSCYREHKRSHFLGFQESAPTVQPWIPSFSACRKPEPVMQCLAVAEASRTHCVKAM